MKKILAFEGDHALVEELRSSFWRYDCEVELVDDEAIGLQRAEAVPPDLILLSIELPGTNGFSVCNKLKHNHSLKNVPLIITSSECSVETFESHRKMRTAAEDYLSKPFEFSELLAKVQQLLPLVEKDPPGLGPAPITAIYDSIDGAFDEIQEGATIHEERSPFVHQDSPAARPFVTPISSSPRPSPMSSSILKQKMIVLWSPDQHLRGQRFTIDDDGRRVLSFGRESDNTIMVEDPAVSANHLMVERIGKGIAVRDLGSGGGTFVNDELVSLQELKGGETVRFGETTLLYLRGLDVDSQLERVIRELAERDPRTRVYSHRRIREKLSSQIETARQEMTSLSVAVIAIDDLNRVAYRYGDQIVQHVIEAMAKIIKKTASGGLIGRDFGAGFIVVMPGWKAKVALGTAEGWRFEAGVSEVIAGKHSVVATLSVGVLEWRDEWNETDLLRRAYRLLFEAQTAGGNRVVARA